MNSTIPPPAGQPDWGKPQFKSHNWLEPIVSILLQDSIVMQADLTGLADCR
jgi:hypothetical protein